MKKKTTLWNGVSVLIVALLVIMAFVRGNAQFVLTVIAIAAWSVWAVVKFLAPYVDTKLNALEARKLREYYEEEERKLTEPTECNDTSLSLLLHVNHRITNYLQSAYPGSTWEWRVEDPEALVANGGTGRIQVFGVADFSHADVTVNKKAEITYEMLKIVPMGENHDEFSDEEEAAPPVQQDPINPQVWYEQKGRVVLENIISDLHSRGHSSLSITENGDVIITQEEREIKTATLEAMPDKVYWHRLAKVFQGEGLAASVTDNAVVVSW